MPYGTIRRKIADLRVYPLASFRDAWNSLTKTERMCQLAQCRGLSAAEIAEENGSEEKTVKNHLSAAHRKMRPAFPNAGQFSLKCAVCFHLGRSVSEIMRQEDAQATGAVNQDPLTIRKVTID